MKDPDSVILLTEITPVPSPANGTPMNNVLPFEASAHASASEIVPIACHISPMRWTLWTVPSFVVPL